MRITTNNIYMQSILSPNSTGFVLRATAGVVLMSALAAQAQTQNAASLPSVTVQSSRSSAEMPARKTLEQERKQLAHVPGGTNLAEPRLGIRGSGIQSNPVNRGVLLLQDGLPLNEADGSFIIGLVEPRNAALISARRGANATTPGATTLGGRLTLSRSPGPTSAVACAPKWAASAARACRVPWAAWASAWMGASP